jgi:hypothetical protein
MSTTESVNESETILRRIRALLDQAESTPYPDEAETFAAKAAELMARYRIDEAMLARSARDPHRIVELDIDLGRGQYVRARLMLLGVVTDAFDCRLLSSSGPDGRTGHVIGHATDTEQVSLLYTSLLLQATRAADHEPAPHGHRRISFRRGFLIGFAQRVGDRLAAQMAHAVRDADRAGDDPGCTATSGSVALVLADRRRAIDSWVDDRYGPLGRLGRATPVSAAAAQRGAAAGDRADIGVRSVQRRRRALRP